MPTEKTRKMSVRRITAPDDDTVYVDLKVIDTIAFIDPREQYQEWQFSFENNPNAKRKIHVKEIGEDKLKVERIDVLSTMHNGLVRGQERQKYFNNQDDSDPHYKTHKKKIYQRNKDGTKNESVWIEVERIDKIFFKDPRDNYQEKLWSLQWPDLDDEEWDYKDLSDPRTEWDGKGINPPWRIDPFQNITDCSLGGSDVAVFYNGSSVAVFSSADVKANRFGKPKLKKTLTESSWTNDLIRAMQFRLSKTACVFSSDGIGISGTKIAGKGVTISNKLVNSVGEGVIVGGTGKNIFTTKDKITWDGKKLTRTGDNLTGDWATKEPTYIKSDGTAYYTVLGSGYRLTINAQAVPDVAYDDFSLDPLKEKVGIISANVKGASATISGDVGNLDGLGDATKTECDVLATLDLKQGKISQSGGLDTISEFKIDTITVKALLTNIFTFNGHWVDQTDEYAPFPTYLASPSPPIQDHQTEIWVSKSAFAEVKYDLHYQWLTWSRTPLASNPSYGPEYDVTLNLTLNYLAEGSYYKGTWGASVIDERYYFVNPGADDWDDYQIYFLGQDPENPEDYSSWGIKVTYPTNYNTPTSFDSWTPSATIDVYNIPFAYNGKPWVRKRLLGGTTYGAVVKFEDYDKLETPYKTFEFPTADDAEYHLDTVDGWLQLSDGKHVLQAARLTFTNAKDDEYYIYYDGTEIASKLAAGLGIAASKINCMMLNVATSKLKTFK